MLLFLDCRVFQDTSGFPSENVDDRSSLKFVKYKITTTVNEKRVEKTFNIFVRRKNNIQLTADWQ